MKRILITLLILAVAAPLFAQAPKGRSETIIVRDGKVYRNGELIETFGGKRAFLGVNVMDLTGDLRSHFGAPKDAGVLVSRLEDNGPAEKAGVRVGDIIVSIDGKDIESAADLRAALRDKKQGDSARVDVLRGKSRQTFVASVIEREDTTLFRAIPFDDLHLRGASGEELRKRLTEVAPEWRARFEGKSDCDELQQKLKDIESRMKELEKKLQK